MLETCFIEQLLSEDSRAEEVNYSKGLANYLADIYLRWAVFFSTKKKLSDADLSVFELPGSIPLSYAKR